MEIRMDTKDDKLRQFCFRFLHRITVTRRELKLFHLADNDKCRYCSSADSIEHTFIDYILYIMVQPVPRYYYNTLERTNCLL